MYTEQLINDELIGTSIYVRWDGNQPDSGEPTRFYVFLDGEDTDFVLWDSYGSTDIVEHVAASRYVYHACANTYQDLAEALTDTINAAVCAGKLGEYA